MGLRLLPKDKSLPPSALVSLLSKVRTRGSPFYDFILLQLRHCRMRKTDEKRKQVEEGPAFGCLFSRAEGGGGPYPF